MRCLPLRMTMKWTIDFPLNSDKAVSPLNSAKSERNQSVRIKRSRLYIQIMTFIALIKAFVGFCTSNRHTQPSHHTQVTNQVIWRIRLESSEVNYYLGYLTMRKWKGPFSRQETFRSSQVKALQKVSVTDSSRSNSGPNAPKVKQSAHLPVVKPIPCINADHANVINVSVLSCYLLNEVIHGSIAVFKTCFDGVLRKFYLIWIDKRHSYKLIPYIYAWAAKRKH